MRVLLVYLNRLVCVARSTNFAYPQNTRTGICRYLARNATTLPSGGNALRHASVGVRCELVGSATFFGAAPSLKCLWTALD